MERTSQQSINTLNQQCALCILYILMRSSNGPIVIGHWMDRDNSGHGRVVIGCVCVCRLRDSRSCNSLGLRGVMTHKMQSNIADMIKRQELPVVTIVLQIAQ